MLSATLPARLSTCVTTTRALCGQRHLCQSAKESHTSSVTGRVTPSSNTQVTAFRRSCCYSHRLMRPRKYACCVCATELRESEEYRYSSTAKWSSGCFARQLRLILLRRSIKT